MSILRINMGAGLGLDFNLYKNDKVSDEMVPQNKIITKNHKFIKKAKDLGWRWGGYEFEGYGQLNEDFFQKTETKTEGN